MDLPNGYSLVIDIAESPTPIMMMSGEYNRYYKRVDCKSHPMNEREVRERYERMFGRRDAVKQMIADADPQYAWLNGQSKQPPWLTLLVVPEFGPIDIFNPATFKVPDLGALLSRRRSNLVNDLPTPRPTYFGLEYTKGSSDQPRSVLRLHRSGVIEYHHAVGDSNDRDWVSSTTGMPESVHSEISAEREACVLLDVLEIAEGLHEAGGYASGLYVQADYRHYGGWCVVGTGASHGLQGSGPLMHTVSTTVRHLGEDRRLFVQGLLDRLWQASGLTHCPVHFDEDNA